MKTCSKCQEPKPATAFSPDTRASDGLQSQCRVCQRLWKAANIQKLRAADKARYEANAPRIRAIKLAAYHADAERKKAVSRAWKIANPQKVLSRWRQYAQENQEAVKAHRQNYYRQNRELYLAHAAKRRSAREQATPSWFDADMRDLVREAYALARQRKELLGGEWHVDHIVPLRNKQVCGLHVPWNLQVILAQENLRKGNRFVTAE